MERRAGAKKDFETQHSGVFATPGLLLAQCSTAESGFKTFKQFKPFKTSEDLERLEEVNT
jgi:hypothetical protein